MYDYAVNLPLDENPFVPYIVDELSFICREDKVGIQVACLFAREAMKHFDNLFLGPQKRRARASMETLLSTGRYKLYYLDKHHYKQLLDDWKNLSWSKYTTEEDYRAWLRRNKLQDNQGNGMRYVEYVRRRFLERGLR